MSTKVYLSADDRVVDPADARVSVFDRGFLYGDSIYETMRTAGGRPVERGPAIDPRKVLEALLEELPVKQAVALAVKITGGKRNELYTLALQLKGG